ncbi:MAG TPA: hypothetical protein DDY14_06640 [Chromatiaceae bacterium]|jgi:hypothetical protein|nr:MAG: hypothetical protein N838_02200 [Thiohalocapsa sp. PB-PSB1]HBG94993.1 hypothetical protein [Chromatiaceae bacterium]HCS92429.1 hypothetical protein [Chromatiaceae bacterium]
MNSTLTNHARTRMTQRGIRERDTDLILRIGTAIDAESVYVLDKDVDREVRLLKQQIDAVERLRGIRAVLAENTVLTVYRASPRTERRLLRNSRRRRRPCDLPARTAQ